MNIRKVTTLQEISIISAVLFILLTFLQTFLENGLSRWGCLGFSYKNPCYFLFYIVGGFTGALMFISAIASTLFFFISLVFLIKNRHLNRLFFMNLILVIPPLSVVALGMLLSLKGLILASEAIK